MRHSAPPRLSVPRLDTSPFEGGGWAEAAPLPPLLLSNGRGAPQQAVWAWVGADAFSLYVRFQCDDREPWGTMRERDDPIYEEEAVEVFLSPGADDPKTYFEFEVSPLGVLFDARVENPHARRRDMETVSSWNCAGIRWAAGLGDGGWWAALGIPWQPMLEGRPMPREWRANFYRIDRPSSAPAEFCAWSPTLADPADFHVPTRFGMLVL